MSSTIKLSPMTLYYLRKLLREKQGQLIWNHADLQQESFESFINTLVSSPENANIALDKLESFVQLRQTLLEEYAENLPPLQSVESAIYALLGLKTISPQEQNDLSKSSNYHSHINSKDIPHVGNSDKTPKAHVKPLEVLSDSLIEEDTTSDNISPQTKQTVKQISHQRCLDLLRELNALFRDCVDWLGVQTAQTILLKAKPNDDWCRQFHVSSGTRLNYEGSLEEWVTQARREQYETWVNQFIRDCQAYATTL